MAIRVNATEVKEIIPTGIADAVILSSMITSASLLVDEIFAGSSLSTERLKLLELYLAAHFVCLTEERGGLTSTKLGDAEDDYADVFTAGYGSTRYGQMVLALDTPKLLATASSTTLTAQFRVL